MTWIIIMLQIINYLIITLSKLALSLQNHKVLLYNDLMTAIFYVKVAIGFKMRKFPPGNGAWALPGFTENQDLFCK